MERPNAVRGRESRINPFRNLFPLIVILGCGFSSARATVEELDLQVGGMQCSLCVQTVQRLVEGIPGVGEVTVDETGRLRVISAPGKGLDLQGIRKQLAKAGYAPAPDEVIRAVGSVSRGLQERLTFKVTGTKDEFDLLEGAELRGLLTTLPVGPAQVTVRARVHRHPEGMPPSLSILSYEIGKGP